MSSVTAYIDQYFLEFGKHIAESKLHIYSESISLRNAIKDYHHDPKAFDKRGIAVRPSAQDLRKGRPYAIAIGGADATGKMLMEMMISNFSRVCNWNLAHAFEVLERFMKQGYAVIGWHDPGLWKRCDLPDPSSSASIVSPEDRVRFLLRSKRSLGIDDIRKRLYTALPRLESDEIGDPSGSTNGVRIWMAILENLRHVIIHSGSQGSLDDLHQRISQRLGLARSGELWDKIENTISRHLSISGDRYTITLYPSESLAPPSLDLDRISSHALEAIATQATIIYQNVLDIDGQKPLWERPR